MAIPPQLTKGKGQPMVFFHDSNIHLTHSNHIHPNRGYRNNDDPTPPKYLIDYVLQLQDCDPHQAILTSKAVILNADVQLEELQLLLVANDAAQENNN